MHLIQEDCLKVWNEYGGCWDTPPDEEDCEIMRKEKRCPYVGCYEYPCWEEDEINDQNKNVSDTRRLPENSS